MRPCSQDGSRDCTAESPAPSISWTPAGGDSVHVLPQQATVPSLRRPARVLVSTDEGGEPSFRCVHLPAVLLRPAGDRAIGAYPTPVTETGREMGEPRGGRYRRPRGDGTPATDGSILP